MNAKRHAGFLPERKKTGRAGNGVKSRLLRAEALEERALLSVSPAEFVSLGGCEARLDLWDSAFVAHERQDAPVATFDCQGCSGLATVLEGAEEYPSFHESVDKLLVAAGQNLDAISQDFVFNLSSRPSSSYIIYLDFDGNVVSGTYWNDGATVVTPPYETDGVEGSFSNAELRDMYEVWLRVSEDYMPFNVNVTTKKPTADQLMKSNAGDKTYGIHVAIGGSCDDWYKSSCGGVAYVGSFTWDSDTPCFVFPKNLHSAKNVAEAASHEIGHTLGLSHDGTSEQGYYGGSDDWAPIMGTGYSQNLTQWSKGEYVDANNFQDDLAIITSNNGFDYRDDDHGDNAGRATPLTLVPVGALGSGVIEKNTDVDFFSFNVAGEKSVLTIGGISAVTNLDALVKLYDSSRNLIATYDPLDAYYATVDLSSLDPGKYYLSVEGTGKIVDGKAIYTDYASLGAYTIKAVEAPSVVVTTTDDVVDEEDGVISLREAINYAGASGLGSTITFDPSLKGKTLTINRNFTLNKAITIDASTLYDSANDAPGVAIDAKKACGFFTTTASLTLKGIEFKNGKTARHGAFDATGGFGASYCVFSDCEAAYGGVLKSDGCDVSIDHCLFENNTATNEGGALRLYNPTVVSVVDSVFKNNSGGNGGAFKLDGGTTSIVNSTFVGNSSSNYGGAIYTNSTAQLKIVGSRFVDNATATDKVGGAIFNYGKLSLENSEFVGNSTGSMGGAIYTDGGEFKAVNSAFYANSASYGGAILTRSDSEIVNCTIAGNFSDKSGGGLFSDNGNVAVYNSIICSNFASFGNSDRYVAHLVGDSYNYLDDEPGFVVGPVFDANGNLTNAQSINLRLLENSPARNAGNNDYVSTDADILGNPRICNNYVDIGAYEFQKPQEPLVSVALSSDAPTVGEAITATVSPENAAVTWQWYRGTKNQLFKTPIDGATSSSYVPTSEDFGLYLSVRAVGRGDYEGTVSTSTSSTVVDRIASVRLMPSKPSVGTTITTTVSPENASVTWQWYRGTSDNLYKTAISGATKSSYTPVAADLGYFISVRAVGKDGYGGTVYASSSASVVDKAGSIELSTDNPAVGTPITATIFPTNADVTWQWYRGTESELFKTPIDGATGNTYTPTWDDFRCYLSVVAVGKGDYEGTVSTSANSKVVGQVLSVSLASTKPSIGKTLTATTAPEDADVTWQWYRGYDWNLFQTPISGANSRSYTPTADDSGYYLTVKAVGKGDYEGSVSASTSSAVPYPVVSVKLSATKPVVGTPLIAKVAPTNAETSWQWYRGTSDNQFATLIDGADSSSYTPTAADVGFYLSVKAIGKGDYEGTVSASTSASVVDVLVSIALSTSKPTSGTLITATVSPENANATWQWYRGTSDNLFQTAISGATANAYEPTDSDVGFYLSVRAVGKGDYEGTVSASTNSPVSGKTGTVALSTDRPAVGTAITATVSPANAEVTWEWYLGTSDDLFKTLIAGAETNTYVPMDTDVGYYISVKAIGKGDYEGTVFASTSFPVVGSVSAIKFLSSKPSVGKPFIATVVPASAIVTWQWYRGSAENPFNELISGAEANYYMPTSDDVGYCLGVKAVGQGDYQGEVFASTSVPVFDKIDSIELTTEKPYVGTEITASVVPSNAVVTWRWYRGTVDDLYQEEISGADSSSYTPTYDDVGYYLTVEASGDGDYVGTVFATTSATVGGKVVSVDLSATKPQLGSALTATVDPSNADVTWQWYRGTKTNLIMAQIAGANSSSYTPTTSDVGYYLSVRAFGQGDYEGVAQASTEEAVILKTVVSVELPSAQPYLGTPITATVAPEVADVTWRWYRGTSDNLFQTAISGAEASSYTPTVADVGFYLSVEAIGKGEYAGTVSASSSATVVGVVGSIEISSMKPAVGEELTATVDPAESDVSWRWYRGTSSEPFKTPITGATSSAYTPTVADVGYYLSVRAVGKGDYEGTVEATASATVVEPLAAVELSSTQPRVGTLLTASVVPENADVTWRWYRGTSDDLFQTAISGATESSYLPTVDDVGLYLSVKAFGEGDYDGEAFASTSAAVVLDWRIYVTIEEDDFDHSDDFDQDGAPDRISLREAYDYVNRYYNGVGEMNDFDNWVLVADDKVDPVTGLSVDQNRAVYKTIRFQEPAGVRNEFEITLDSEIASDKSFTIDGAALGGAQVSVSGAYFSRIFKINSGTIVADNLILKNGYAVGNDDDLPETSECGGALLIQNGGTYVANGGGFSSNVATQYGGAVYVAEGGSFAVDSVEFEYNEATRGGAIINYGTVTVSGTTSFEGNSATPMTDNPTNGSFGGAIYNAGALTIGSASSDARTTFDGNVASESMDGSPVVSADGVLKGYCGGAIYNTTGGSVEAYDVDYVNNFAGKYGGAISNFSSFVAVNSTFENNRASSGGAAQSSGIALFDSCSFAANVALRSCFALIAEGVDYGGNGGAVFASRAADETSGVAFTGATTFSENQAANAGGAIDVVSGALTFDGADVVVAGNVAGSIGGAIVFGGDVNFNESAFAFEENRAGALEVFDFDELFHQEPPQGEFGFYAPNVAAGCDASDQAIVDAKRNFFPDENVLDAEKFVALARYETTTAGVLTFDDLIGDFDVPPTVILASVDGEDAREMSAGDSLSLSVGPHTILFADVDYPDVVFRANVYVVDASTSVILSQLEIGSGTFSAADKKCPVGVSIRIVSSKSEPVAKWTLNWGDGKKESFDAFGYTLNAYHVYDKAKRYDLTLTAIDADGVSATYENLGYCVAKTPEASGAELELDELFADSDWVDELFE